MTAVFAHRAGSAVRFGALAAVERMRSLHRAGVDPRVIGPNGAGKTTLFNLITGDLPPSGGRVLFAGEDVTRLPAPPAGGAASRARSRSRASSRS